MSSPALPRPGPDSSATSAALHARSVTEPTWIEALSSRATLLALVLLSSGAWIWPTDSATVAAIEQPFGPQFRLAVYLIFLAHLLVTARHVARLSKGVLLLVGFQFTSLILAITFSGQWYYGAQSLLTFSAITLGVGTATYRLGVWPTFEFLMRVAVVILALSIVLALVAPALGKHGYPFPGVWRGLFPHKNQLGQFSFITLLLAPLLFVNRRRALASCATALALVCLYFSSSGTAIVCAALAACIFLAAWIMSKSAMARLGVSIAIASVILLAVAFRSQVFDVMMSALGKDATFTGRTEIWYYFLRLGSESPIVGHGPRYLMGDVAYLEGLRSLTRFAQLRSAHNGYIEAFVAEGVLGVSAYLAPYIALIWIGALGKGRDAKISLLALPVALSLLSYNMFESANSTALGLGTLVLNLTLISLSLRRETSGGARYARP